jgi:hypothetical protein
MDGLSFKRAIVSLLMFYQQATSCHHYILPATGWELGMTKEADINHSTFQPFNLSTYQQTIISPAQNFNSFDILLHVGQIVGNFTSSIKKTKNFITMNGKYITTQIRITSLSHRNQKKSLEPNEEKLADLSKFVTIWKKGKARQDEMQVPSEF